MSAKTRACVISPEINGPHKNGGVGTHCFHFSAFLSRTLGQEVTFLYTGAIAAHDEAYWKNWFRRELNLDFAWLPPARQSSVPSALYSIYGRMAGQVYEWLRDKQFDACHFQEMLGNGFRCFQAKRLGVAFQNTVLTCMVHSSHEWISQAMQAFPQGGAEELRAKFLERYCIERSDLLISPSRYMLRWLEQEQIKIPSKNVVLPYLSDPELKPVGCRPAAGHIIFFGRLEVRKGLLLFLETLLQLDREKSFARLKVTFLGKSGYTPDGGGFKSIRKFQREFSPAIEVVLQTELGQPEALDFLKTNNDALVVCPSLIDNSPFAIIESLQLGLNIIAANSGGIPELFATRERLFEPEPGALALKIKAGLANNLPPPAKSWQLEENTKLWRQFCEQAVPDFISQTPVHSPPAAAAVKVYFAPGASSSLRALESLRAQTCQPLSVAVLCAASGRPSPALTGELDKICQQQGWEILTDPAPSNSTAALANPTPNQAKLEANGSAPHYAIFLLGAAFTDSKAIAKVVHALEYSSLDGLSCWAQITDEKMPLHTFVYEPLGSFLEGGMFSNLFGTGCVILKLDPRRAGPLPIERLLRPQGLWSYLAEAAVRGEQWDVLPDVLISLPRSEAVLSCSHLDYNGLMEVIRGYGKNFSMWFHSFLVDAVTTQAPRLRAEQDQFHLANEMRALSSWAPKRILYKIKREARRLLTQLTGSD